MGSNGLMNEQGFTVRRRTYHDGTVSYYWEHDGEKVFTQFAANGRVKFGLQGRVMKVSGGPYTMSGVNKGIEFTNVGLEPKS